jgi:hypothetical protein
MIDWLAPTDDILEAKRIGFEEAWAQAESQIEGMKDGVSVRIADLEAERDRYKAVVNAIEELIAQRDTILSLAGIAWGQPYCVWYRSEPILGDNLADCLQKALAEKRKAEGDHSNG